MNEGLQPRASERPRIGCYAEFYESDCQGQIFPLNDDVAFFAVSSERCLRRVVRVDRWI